MLTAILLAAATACADPAALDQQVDAMLVSLHPGLSLDQVADITNTPREFLVPARGEVLVHAMAKEGSRVADVQLACGYADGRLAECRISGARHHTQFVDPAAWEKLTLGVPIGAVLVGLCEPEAVEVAPDGKVTLSYSMDYPFEAYVPFGPVHLRFDGEGRLQEKVGHSSVLELDHRLLDGDAAEQTAGVPQLPLSEAPPRE
jgi:hypothetical protein